MQGGGGQFSCCLLGRSGSTSSSLCEHWISRLMGSRPPSQASSGSSRRTSLASLSESAEFAAERSEDDGEEHSHRNTDFYVAYNEGSANTL